MNDAQSVLVDDSSRTNGLLALLLEAAALCALFLIVDCAVLRWIFPGYLDPFWPHHSDFYMPAAMAFSPEGLWTVLTYPRPVGQAFFWFIGHLRTRGAMVAVLLVVAANYSLIVMIGRRLFRTSVDWKLLLAAVLFAYLLASHPYQYQMSTWDAFAQLSLLLLLNALILRMHGAPLSISAVLVLLAFLSKETFILSAGFLALVWFVSHRFSHKALRPLIVLVVAAVLAMAAEHFASSPFTSGGSEHGGPYEIVLNISSVLSQWFLYTTEGLNWLGFAVVVLTALAAAVSFGFRSSEFLWSVSLPIAGLLALLPNSVLPNHHFAGYSWNAAYLIFAPVIVLAAVIARQAVATLLCAVVFFLTISSPMLSAKAFEQQDWIVMNQKRQKLFLQTFGSLINQLQTGGQKVLVSGVDFPFTMFLYKQSVRSLKMPAGTQFFVVRYDNQTLPSLAATINRHSEMVQTIDPADVKNYKFDQAWLIRDDGSLIMRILKPASENSWSEGGVNQSDALIYPGLADIFGPNKRPGSGPLNGYGYLACGTKLLDYNALGLAQKCLTSAASLLPDNPYPFYFLGISLEKQGNTSQALNAYRRAVALQANSPNPVFQAALKKLE